PAPPRLDLRMTSCVCEGVDEDADDDADELDCSPPAMLFLRRPGRGGAAELAPPLLPRLPRLRPAHAGLSSTSGLLPSVDSSPKRFPSSSSSYSLSPSS